MARMDTVMMAVVHGCGDSDGADVGNHYDDDGGVDMVVMVTMVMVVMLVVVVVRISHDVPVQSGFNSFFEPLNLIWNQIPYHLRR